MAANDTPAAEVAIDDRLVRSLLAEQMPDFSGLELVEVGAGWDNVIFRLGTALTVRLPRRAASAVLVEHEQRWLPELAPLLPLPVPAPIGFGRPGLGYPWSWSVYPWLPGETATVARFDSPVRAARALGGFLVALHRPAPADAPENPFRGVPLAARDERLRAQVAQMAGVIDGPSVLACWDDLVGTPVFAGPRLWLHGDLRAGNLLVDRGRLSAVIDFGDITAGDPATDLSVAWMLFDAPVRAELRAVVGADDDLWRRARGWALALGVAYVASAANDPVLTGQGHALIAAALSDSS